MLLYSQAELGPPVMAKPAGLSYCDRCHAWVAFDPADDCCFTCKRQKPVRPPEQIILVQLEDTPGLPEIDGDRDLTLPEALDFIEELEELEMPSEDDLCS